MDTTQREKVITKFRELEQVLMINNPQRTPSSVDEVSDEALLVFLGLIMGQVSNVMNMHPAYINRVLGEVGIIIPKEKEVPEEEPKARRRTEKLD